MLYKYIFARKLFYPLHRLMFALSTRGLGVLNYENPTLSGENFLLRKIAAQHWTDFTCIDVGANIGSYSYSVKKIINTATVYAVEPHPKTFLKLKKNAHNFGYFAFNIALSNNNSLVNIFDTFLDESGDDYSTHASLYKEVFMEKKYDRQVHVYQVQSMTLDEFLVDNNINEVNLLKIDVEGHEYNVLLGAHEALRSKKIGIIQFEFNSMNRFSRVYMKDFADLLSDYRLYRLMQDFLAPIQVDNALSSELFAYQNIVAIRQDICLI